MSKKEYYAICRTFKEWLAINGNRFNLKYKIRHYPGKRKLNIYFENVAPEIFCTVTEWSGVEVGVEYKRKFWDYICDFECAIRCSENGKYFCGYCTPKKYYSTSQDLVINHCFENFLKWVNEHFTPFHELELLKIGHGCTSAILVDKRIPENKHSEKRDGLETFVTALKPINGMTKDRKPEKTKTFIVPVIKGECS